MAGKQIELKDYRVHWKKRIGAGGQSSVYEAYKGEIKYAAKCIQNKTVKALMDSELLVYQKSKTHNNVIKILDFCDWEEGNSAWIFMEFCNYGSLNDYFENFPRQFSERKVKLNFMLQISAGIKFLHELRLIHRDIKPSNVLLTDERGNIVVKISDFGVSRDDTATSTKTVVGTLQFCAPELWPFDESMPRKYNAKIDIFALGLTFLTIVQEDCNKLGLIPKVKGLTKSQESLVIGHLMYIRKEDGNPPLIVVAEGPGDDEFMTVAKSIIREATLVDPKERVSAEYIYQKLAALVVKQVGE